MAEALPKRKRPTSPTRKPFTGTGVMVLASPGRGSCDTPKDRYDPFVVLATVRRWEA
jgi:hypothetical protein